MVGRPVTAAPYYDDGTVTIYHGDALALLADLDPLDVDAVITDPPYSSGGAFRGDRILDTVAKYVQTSTGAYRPQFAGDNRDQRAYLIWAALWLGAALAQAREGAHLAMFTDWRQLPTTTDAAQVGGWVWRGLGVWDKTEAARPRMGGLTAQCEYIVWATAGPLDADRHPVFLPGVMRTPTVRDKVHIAEKPGAVLDWLVRLAPPGGLVLDPFMGSGSTLRAAKDQGRRAIGFDIDVRYCEMASKRMAQESLFLPAPPPPVQSQLESLFAEEAAP
jgi:site-specific DNA-methyltransferase (adenine-specific)